MRYFLSIILFLGAASFAHAATYKVGGDCGPLDPHVPDADVAHKAATGVNVNGASMPMDNITIPMELPLSDYADTSGINANLSDTRIRSGDIGVNLNTGTTSFNGQEISQPPIYRADCGEETHTETESIYSTK